MELLSDKNNAERMLINKATVTRTPVNGSIELLPLCNMNCDFCYVRLARSEMERVGHMHTADEGCRYVVSLIDRWRASAVSRF